jgi:Txe/YoeB family toxin of Txe-Axe toxin-antitoxin module
VSWTVQLSRQAVKDAKRLAQSGYKEKAKNLLNILKTNPFMNPPPYKKLVGNLDGFYKSSGKKTPLSLAKGMNCHA